MEPTLYISGSAFLERNLSLKRTMSKAERKSLSRLAKVIIQKLKLRVFRGKSVSRAGVVLGETVKQSMLGEDDDRA